MKDFVRMAWPSGPSSPHLQDEKPTMQARNSPAFAHHLLGDGQADILIDRQATRKIETGLHTHRQGDSDRLTGRGRFDGCGTGVLTS